MIRYIFLLASAIVIGALVLLVFLLPTEQAVLAEQSQINSTKIREGIDLLFVQGLRLYVRIH